MSCHLSGQLQMCDQCLRRVANLILVITAHMFFVKSWKGWLFQICCCTYSDELITRRQHGFLSKHSTCSQLLESLNDWSLSLMDKCDILMLPILILLRLLIRYLTSSCCLNSLGMASKVTLRVGSKLFF